MSEERFHIKTDDWNCTRIWPWCPMDKKPFFHAAIFIDMDGNIRFDGNLVNVTRDEWEKFTSAMELAFVDSDNKKSKATQQPSIQEKEE